jgi:hypothetical protein
MKNQISAASNLNHEDWSFVYFVFLRDFVPRGSKNEIDPLPEYSIKIALFCWLNTPTFYE